MSKKREYLVQPVFSDNRNADEEWRDRITDKFSFYKGKDGNGNGNIDSSFKYNKRAKAFVINKGLYPNGYTYIYETISSAFLLYRLACTFKGKINVAGPSGYKVVWFFPLIHNQTKEIISFGEWKGAAGIWSRFLNIEEMPEELTTDILDLLNYLTSNVCAHPYDGVVAGSVA